MATTTYLRLFPAVKQFELKNGALNVGGRLFVYYEGTDDLAEIYDENGSRLQQPAILDNDGRALGLFVDAKKVYRLEVQDAFGAMQFTVRKMVPSGGGAGSALGKTYDVVSNDGSILVDKFDEGGTTTFDLSLGIDANELKPSCLKASAAPVTTDGKFVFEELVREGNLLSVDGEGKVRMEPAWYHFTAIVELSYDGTPVNEAHQVTLWTTLSNSVIDLDTSYAHRESIELSGDIHVVGNNTEFPLGVSGLDTGITASLIGFDIHAVTGHDGNNEYHAGEGITIVNATKTISADFESVQEKLVAGDNISITGNVISAGNFSQEQASWTEEDTTSPAYIRNKPDLDIYATQAQLSYGLAGKQDVISDLAQIRAGAASGSSAVQPADLAAVATTGDYNSLNNRPNLTVYATKTEVNTGLAAKQDVISDLSAIRAGAQAGATAVQPAALDSYATKVELNTGLSGKQDTINDLSEIRSGAAAGSTALQPSDVAEVATTGDYDDLTNKPSIPTATSDLTNDSGFITSADVPVKDVQVDGASVVNAQGVAEITMPDLSGYATTQALNTGLAGKQDTISDLSTIRSGAAAGATAVQPADLAAVATTGDYDDLSNKPTIPSGAQLVPAATSADADKVLTVDSLGVPGWAIVPAQSTGLFQATYGTSTYNEVRDAVADNKIVYCYVNGRMAFLAFVLSNSYEFQYYRSNNSSSGTDSVFVYQVNSSGWTTVERAVKAGNIRYPVTQVNVNGSSAMTGTVANITIPAAPTVDQTYDASSANAQSGVAVAQAIGSVDAVPDVTSSDSGKVLVANYSGGAGSYSWASTPPANAIILDSSSTWADFHTPYSAGRKDIYYKHTSPYAPLDSRAELYLHLTAVSDVDGSSTNFTYALFEGAWQSGGVEYSIRCKIRYSGVPLVFITPLTADRSYSASSTNAQSGVAVAQAISAVNQVPSSTSADADKVLTVNSQGAPAWASAQAPISAGTGIDITNNVVSVDTSVVATQTDLASKQDTISDLATIRSGAQLGSTAVQPGDLATVATTGSYDDLVDKPTIPAAQVNSDWNSNSGVSQILNKPTLAAVATTGDYDDLSNKPSIPAAQVNSDWNATSGVSEILNKPSIPTATSDLTNDSGFITLSDVPAQVNADWNSSSGASEILNKPVPKTLTAGTGISITENQSTITISSSVTAPVRDVTVDGTSVVSNGVAAITSPTVDQTYDASSTNAQSGVAVASGISAAIAASVMPISVVASLPANPDPNTLYVVTGA